MDPEEAGFYLTQGFPTLINPSSSPLLPSVPFPLLTCPNLSVLLRGLPVNDIVPRCRALSCVGGPNTQGLPLLCAVY